MKDLTERLMEVGFQRYEGELASGVEANNKVDLSYQVLHRHSGLLRMISAGIAEIVEPYDVQFVVGVPSGAAGLARHEVTQDIDGWPVYLVKNRRNGKFEYPKGTPDEYVVNHLERGALIDDVVTTGGSLKKTLDEVPGLKERIVVASAVLLRGNADELAPLGVPFQPLSEKYIAPVLPDDSEMWHYADLPKL
jgi:orotate phosphoribosyltransferase